MSEECINLDEQLLEREISRPLSVVSPPIFNILEVHSVTLVYVVYELDKSRILRFVQEY
jgi:hypothetical protein